MRPQRDLSLPMLRAQVSIAPETLNEETRTVEVRFYSGASVQRFPFFDDPYELAFDIDPKAVRLDRFNAGAPLVDNHRAFGPVGDVVLGVVEKAWMAEDGGHATVKIAADRPDIVTRLKDGILRNFSMGAVIHQLKDITEKGDPQRRLLAIDWEPHELSIVPVPADPGAQALAQAERFPCTLTGASAPERSVMETIKVRLLASGEVVEIDEKDFDSKLHSKELTVKTAAHVDPKDAKRKVDDKIAADEAHAAEVRRVCQHYNLNEVWAQRHIKLGTSIEQVLADASEQRAKLAPMIDGAVSIGEDYDSLGWRTDKMAEALSARAMRKPCPESARQYALSSIAECAFECLSLNGRTRGRNLDARRNPDDVISLALHTTSDFPGLLGNVLNKQLLPAFELTEPNFRKIAAKKTFKDFRPHKFLRAGDFPVPLQVDEHGEYTYGTLTEGSETAALVTYGRILGLSRQLLVNDDLGALQDIGSTAGRRVADFMNTTFFTTLITAGSGLGPALADTLTVYHATHGNITGAGALDNTRLAAAVALMMVQTSLDGLKMNVSPKILLVSPANLANALTLVAALTPAQASQVNPFAGQFQVIADANLTGTRFYLLADPGVLPNYIWGSLEGQEGPRIETRVGFSIDGVEIKLALDYAVAAIEYRGGSTGAGV
jgi:hypothetical protein